MTMPASARARVAAEQVHAAAWWPADRGVRREDVDPPLRRPDMSAHESWCSHRSPAGAAHDRGACCQVKGTAVPALPSSACRSCPSLGPADAGRSHDARHPPAALVMPCVWWTAVQAGKVEATAMVNYEGTQREHERAPPPARTVLTPWNTKVPTSPSSPVHLHPATVPPPPTSLPRLPAAASPASPFPAAPAAVPLGAAVWPAVPWFPNDEEEEEEPGRRLVWGPPPDEDAAWNRRPCTWVFSSALVLFHVTAYGYLRELEATSRAGRARAWHWCCLVDTMARKRGQRRSAYATSMATSRAVDCSAATPQPTRWYDACHVCETQNGVGALVSLQTRHQYTQGHAPSGGCAVGRGGWRRMWTAGQACTCPAQARARHAVREGLLSSPDPCLRLGLTRLRAQSRAYPLAWRFISATNRLHGCP